MQTFLQIAFERVTLLNKCLSKIIQGIPTSFRHSNFDFFFGQKIRQMERKSVLLSFYDVFVFCDFLRFFAKSLSAMHFKTF